MGSLPNLHELGKDHINNHHHHHHHHDLRLGHTTLFGTTFSQEERSKILHRYSEHSRVRKIRSNGHNEFKIMYDDPAIIAASAATAASPTTSNRSVKNLKRKDSLSSSIGATSVRRLLAVVRPTTNQLMMINNRDQTHYSRHALLTNFTIFCLIHLIITATFLPFLTLQTSVSVWIKQNEQIGSGAVQNYRIYIGSILLSIVYLFASISVLFGPCLIHKFTANLIFLSTYLVFSCYYFTHLYPVIYLLLPVSILFGIFFGLLYITQIIFLMTLSTKISYLRVDNDLDEDIKYKRKTCVIRRLARAYQAAHDFGLIIGSILTTLLIQHTININNQNVVDQQNLMIANNLTITTTNLTNLTTINNTSRSDAELALENYNNFLDNLFDTYEGARLCGAQACPRSLANLINQTDFLITTNNDDDDDEDDNKNNNNNNIFNILPNSTTTVLSIIYGSLSLLTTIMTVIGLDRIHTFVYQDPLERPLGLTALKSIRESFRDTKLRLAAPLALFIGFEQAFIYADFAKSYVVCTLGIQQLNLVFLSMGVLQAIAAATLSMLIKSIRRYYAVAVGFTFHACLLMVLILWKPIEDDPGLFYVISAAWGVCNAIWEILNFTLLTTSFTDNWETAFANLTFYRFLGLSLSFVFHGLLCNYYKLYLLSFLLVVAVVPFTWLELRLENLRKVKNMTRL